MSKRLFCFVLAVSFYSFFTLPAYSDSKTDAQVTSTEKVRAGISKLGVGRDAQVSVRLRNNMVLTGYISEAGSDSFSITQPKINETKNVAYADVSQVKGNNLTTKAKVAIWVGVAVGITLLLWLIKTQVDDCC